MVMFSHESVVTLKVFLASGCVKSCLTRKTENGQMMMSFFEIYFVHCSGKPNKLLRKFFLKRRATLRKN